MDYTQKTETHSESAALDGDDTHEHSADLLSYFRFLWLELSALSREMGVPMLHTETLLSIPGAPPAEWTDRPASSRAKAVLAAATAPKPTDDNGQQPYEPSVRTELRYAQG